MEHCIVYKYYVHVLLVMWPHHIHACTCTLACTFSCTHLSTHHHMYMYIITCVYTTYTRHVTCNLSTMYIHPHTCMAHHIQHVHAMIIYCLTSDCTTLHHMHACIHAYMWSHVLTTLHIVPDHYSITVSQLALFDSLLQSALVYTCPVIRYKLS